MSQAKYSIKSQEEGRGPIYTKRFRNLKAVAEYIQAYWQGVDYMDGPDGFHTDYSTFTCHGFLLTDLGKRVLVYPDMDYFEWQWNLEFQPKTPDQEES